MPAGEFGATEEHHASNETKLCNTEELQHSRKRLVPVRDEVSEKVIK